MIDKAGRHGRPVMKKASYSRRDFLRLGGTAALAVALPLGGLTLSGCSSSDARGFLDATLRDQRETTDHADRTMTTPTPNALEQVYFTSAMAQIAVFALEPKLQAGTGMQFTPQELKYLSEGSEKLLYMGTLSAGGEIDREMLLRQDVQLVVDCSGRPLTASDISQAENLQKQTKIPTVCVDGSFTRIVECYRYLGELLGKEQRADKLA